MKTLTKEPPPLLPLLSSIAAHGAKTGLTGYILMAMSDCERGGEAKPFITTGPPPRRRPFGCRLHLINTSQPISLWRRGGATKECCVCSERGHILPFSHSSTPLAIQRRRERASRGWEEKEKKKHFFLPSHQFLCAAIIVREV